MQRLDVIVCFIKRRIEEKYPELRLWETEYVARQYGGIIVSELQFPFLKLQQGINDENEEY